MLPATAVRHQHFEASAMDAQQPDSRNTDDKIYSTNISHNALLSNYLTKFSQNLQQDTVECVLASFVAALQKLEQKLTQMEEATIEKELCMDMLGRLNHFRENLPDWFNQRLSDKKLNCHGLTQANIDGVTHHGFDHLLTASTEDLTLHMQTQQSFDQALLQFKYMLVNAGFRTKNDLVKLPIARELFRSNPVNLSALISPIINKFTGQSSINWIFYRLFHTELYSRLPAIYQGWQKNLRNYHDMLSNTAA